MKVKALTIKIGCILLALVMALCIAACDKNTSKKKKKVVIKKVIVSSENSNSDNESNDDFVTENEDTEYVINRPKRDLAEKDNVISEKFEPEFEEKRVAWNGPTGYVIVVSSKSDNEAKYNYQLAIKLQKYFKEKANVTVGIVKDSVARSKKEIIIGSTTRYSTKLNSTQFAVRLDGEKLFFDGGNFAMVEKAVDWFCTLGYEKGYINTISGVSKDFKNSVNGYQYVWGDEFDGKGIDFNKWCFNERMSGTSTLATLDTENVAKVEDGRLKLSAIRYFDIENPAYEYATNISLCTLETMSYRFGYLEMRAKVPFNRGAWPSFWLLSNGALGNSNPNLPYTTEIDIFEVFASKDTAIPNLHKWKLDETLYGLTHTQFNTALNASKQKSYTFNDIDNLSNEYHTYGFEWNEKEMKMFVDGKEYITFDLNYDFDETGSGMNGFKEQPVFIILNNFIFVKDLDETTDSRLVNDNDLPFNYYIDWIRLYQKSGTGDLNFAK